MLVRSALGSLSRPALHGLPLILMRTEYDDPMTGQMSWQASLTIYEETAMLLTARTMKDPGISGNRFGPIIMPIIM